MALQYMASPVPDRELKKGSAELMILALLEDRARHGYEIGQLIELRSARRDSIQRRFSLSVALSIGETELDSWPVD